MLKEERIQYTEKINTFTQFLLNKHTTEKEDRLHFDWLVNRNELDSRGGPIKLFKCSIIPMAERQRKSRSADWMR